MENNDTPDVVESEDSVQEPAPVPHEAEQSPEPETEAETIDIEALKSEMDSLKKENEDLAEKLQKKRQTERAVKKKADSPKKTTTDELDYGQKAFLNTEGIKEFDFVEEQMRESGIKDVESLIANGYFQSRLKEHRDAQAVKEATPSGTRTDSKPANTKVDYWIDRGELPPNTPEYVQLRRDVVNERVKREKSGNNFSPNTIVEN